MKRTIRILGAAGFVAFFSIGATQRTCLVEPSSMYLNEGLLYVSDLGSGIHVYVASTGTAPAYRTTIPLQGNGGIAMKDSIIYANTWGSILALRLRADNSVDTVAVVYDAGYYEPTGDYVDYHRGWGCRSVDYAGESMPTNAASSYAVFAVIDTFLYHVTGSSLVTLSIANPSRPRTINTTYLNWGVETLFATDRYLFVGSTTGMYIFNRSPNPASPVLITTFAHARACDPVVVRDTIAFITLRSGNACGTAEDAFMAVSVADPTSPVLLDKVQPPSPYGLAVNDTLVYIGNGASGWSLYSCARPDSLYQVAAWPQPAARDFIWSGTMLYMLGTTQVAAYDVTVPSAPVRLGAIQ